MTPLAPASHSTVAVSLAVAVLITDVAAVIITARFPRQFPPSLGEDLSNPSQTIESRRVYRGVQTRRSASRVLS